MFAGGASWAEAQMKAGKFLIKPAPSGSRPDLTGLSCRWNPVDAHNGEIVSIIAVPGASGADARFQQLVADVVAIAAEQARGAHPIPEEGPQIEFTLQGISTEARATAPAGKRLYKKFAIFAQIGLTIMLEKLGLTAGGFDPKAISANWFKILISASSMMELKMTIDIDAARLTRIEERLEDAAKEGILSVRFTQAKLGFDNLSGSHAAGA